MFKFSTSSSIKGQPLAQKIVMASSLLIEIWGPTNILIFNKWEFKHQAATNGNPLPLISTDPDLLIFFLLNF